MLAKVLRVLRRPSQRGTDQARTFCREFEQRIELESCNRIAAIATTISALPEDWQISIEQDMAFVRHATVVRDAMRRVRLVTPQLHPETRLRLQVSTLFLADSAKYLIGDPRGRERMHLVTGVIAPDGTRVLSRMEKLTYDEQNPAYVKAAAGQTHKQLVDLERDGHALLAVMHSHITHGAESTRPSPTDIANQERFVRIGWDDAIAGIVSLDGFVRLFSTAKDFDLDVYGNGVERISDAPREKILKLMSVPP